MEASDEQGSSYLMSARELFNKGRHSAVIKVCTEGISHHNINQKPKSSRLVCSLLNEKARALRNLGFINDALLANIESLRNAFESGDELDTAWQLAVFGKFFGKYLQRRTLFSACLREGVDRLEKLLEVNAGQDQEEAFLLFKRYAVIQDLLGGYYRDLATEDSTYINMCEDSFFLAIKYHTAIKNSEGVSRSSCHLAYARATNPWLRNLSSSEREAKLTEALSDFEKGAEKLLSRRRHIAKRGRPTRLAQLADIYLQLNNTNTAEALLKRSIQEANIINDPRSLILALRTMSKVLSHLNDLHGAAGVLEDAREMSQNRNLFGFERGLLTDLARIYLKLQEPSKAIDLFEYHDRLAAKELRGFSSDDSAGALELFQSVAPKTADRYLREGQRQDYEKLIGDLLNNGKDLRETFYRSQKNRSIEMQRAIYRFSRDSIRHAIKNELYNINMAIRGAKLAGRQDGEEAFSEISRSALKIREIVGSESANREYVRVSFMKVLKEVALAMIDESKVEIATNADIVFKDLIPELLKEALKHLVENIKAAVNAAPPQEATTPHLFVAHEVTDSIIRFCLYNPGVNPDAPADGGGVGFEMHGFRNTQWFFRDVLGFSCNIEQRNSGPRTMPYKSNCVVIAAPRAQAGPSSFFVEEPWTSE